MSPLNVKVKKLSPEAIIPSYAKPGDAGLDLTAISKETDLYGQVTYGTGLAVEIPEGYLGFILPRSSIFRTSLDLSNSVGLIDSEYRGEIKFKFNKISNKNVVYNIGERVGQLVILPYPKINLVESEELSETVRGSAGFGSSGV